MKIGIIGLGLMGGSIAKALNTTYEIIGYDQNQTSLDYALKENIISNYETDLASFFNSVDVSYLCIYPKAIPEFVKENEALIPNGHIIIEISGIKSKLMNTLESSRSKHYDIVYSHPIAGREKQGVEYSKKEIFNKANYVIIPTENNLASSVDLCERLAKEMNFNNISKMTKEEHDDIIAYTSQLTHVLALALVNSDDEEYDTSKFIGDSYRDLTRISMINEDLWSELLLNNKDFLVKRIKSFEKALSSFEKAIVEEDIDTLKKLMREAKKERLKIEKEDKQ